eukprot:CFRG0782T1
MVVNEEDVPVAVVVVVVVVVVVKEVVVVVVVEEVVVVVVVEEVVVVVVVVAEEVVVVVSRSSGVKEVVVVVIVAVVVVVVELEKVTLHSLSLLGKMEVKLDTRAFNSRIEIIYRQWERTGLKDVDAWVIPMGKPLQDVLYSKTLALHTYLFAYEFNESIIAFTKTQVIFYAGAKKLAYFRQLELKPEDRKPDMPELVFIEKQRNNFEASFEELWALLKSSKEGKTLGYIKKDTFEGKFYQAWLSFLESKKNDDSMELVDTAGYIGRILAIKDGDEQATIKRACTFSATVMDKFFRGKLESIIENDEKKKHIQLSEDIEAALSDPAQVNMQMNTEVLESCYFPIVQSGGQYDLKISAISNENILQPDVVIASLGARYKSYCSNIARTYMINPSHEQSEAYKLVVKLRGMVIKAMLPGVELCEMYNLCTSYIEEHKPDYRQYFVKNIGFGIGIEYRDSETVVNAKNHYKAANGMTFNLAIGFQGIPSSKKGKPKTFAVMVADTILVHVGENTVLTDRCAVKYNDIVYTFEDEEEDKKPEKSIKEKKSSVTQNPGDYAIPVRTTRSGAVLAGRTRGQDHHKVSEDENIREAQAKLLEKINAEARRRILEGEDDESETRLDIKQFTAYSGINAMPQNNSALKSQRIYIDNKAFAVMLPVYGQSVPFHITMVKNIANISKTDMTGFGTLRINFLTPGAVLKKDTGDNFSFAHAEAAWLKELSYRSTDQSYLDNVSAQIKALQKQYKQRLASKKEKEDLVEQDDLILTKGKPLARLTDLLVRPAFSKKRATGMLEAHENGFRFQSGGQRLDILYSNIRHAFFQPCKHELIVLLHLHLKNPIMGPYSKKQGDIQLFAEVVDGHIDLGNKANNYGDRDEIEAEQRERQMRKRLDQAFYNFTQKVPAINFEMPERKLGFNGVPGRSNVFLMPTSSALVSLVEQPPFVFPLEDVELVHLERVAFGNKNFDMVFVFKDYRKPPVRISTIPSQNLDDIQRWLHESGMKFSEGPRPLNWATLMKLVLTNPRAFFDEEGGWGILELDGANGSSDEDGSMEGDDAAFELSDADLDEEESESDYSDEDQSDDSASGSGSESEYSEEEGLDWDELEEQARREDRRKDGNDDVDSDQDRKRRRRSGGVGGSSKKQKRR